MEALGGELRGVWDRQWNSERFIVFLTVIMQRARHVTASQEIRRRIENWLEDWQARRHGMLAEDTVRMCAKYLTNARREESEEHRDQNFHNLVLQGELWTAVRWITETETGGMLQPAER